MEIGLLTGDHFEAVRDLVAHPSLATEFETLQGPNGLENVFSDPYGSPDWRWIGWLNGEPAGFAYAFVMPLRTGSFAIVRLGVIEPCRRRGLGRALLDIASEQVTHAVPACSEICVSGFVPNDPVTRFAEASGYSHARYFWMMERPRGPVGPIEWPAGIDLRTFDGSDQAFQDWTDIYNDSFANHWHSVSATVDHGRHLAAKSSFDSDGLLLAYRDGRCVGFCRNDLYPARGEIGVLGVSTSARGIGLGRALLRWGIAWLDQKELPITLFVDGENENALGLYRSEGFRKVRTRQIWARQIG